MKGKRVIAGSLLAGILAVTLAGCKNTDNTKEESEKPVITLGSDSYPPYNYLNEDTDRQEGIYPSGSDGAVPGHLFKSDGSASGRPCDVDYSDYYLIYRAAEVYYCRCCCRSSKILMNV